MKLQPTTTTKPRALSFKTGVRAGITPIPIPGALTTSLSLYSRTALSSYVASTGFDPGGGI